MSSTVPAQGVPDSSQPAPEHPLRRAAHAYVVLIPLFTVAYIPTLYLVNDFGGPMDGWGDLAYIVMALAIYAGSVFVVIPGLTFTVGRWIDRRTSADSAIKAAAIFAAVAGLIGLLPALIMLLDGNFGLLPLVTYVAAPMVATFLARVVLPTALRNSVVRWSAIVMTGVCVVVCLMAIVNVAANVA